MCLAHDHLLVCNSSRYLEDAEELLELEAVGSGPIAQSDDACHVVFIFWTRSIARASCVAGDPILYVLL
jgi:hypothetical protein